VRGGGGGARAALPDGSAVMDFSTIEDLYALGTAALLLAAPACGIPRTHARAHTVGSPIPPLRRSASPLVRHYYKRRCSSEKGACAHTGGRWGGDEWAAWIGRQDHGQHASATLRAAPARPHSLPVDASLHAKATERPSPPLHRADAPSRHSAIARLAVHRQPCDVRACVRWAALGVCIRCTRSTARCPLRSANCSADRAESRTTVFFAACRVFLRGARPSAA
jgi:hypothetical protein